MPASFLVAGTRKGKVWEQQEEEEEAGKESNVVCTISSGGRIYIYIYIFKRKSSERKYILPPILIPSRILLSQQPCTSPAKCQNIRGKIRGMRNAAPASIASHLPLG